MSGDVQTSPDMSSQLSRHFKVCPDSSPAELSLASCTYPPAGAWSISPGSELVSFRMNMDRKVNIWIMLRMQNAVWTNARTDQFQPHKDLHKEYKDEYSYQDKDEHGGWARGSSMDQPVFASWGHHWCWADQTALWTGPGADICLSPWKKNKNLWIVLLQSTCS